MPITLSNSELRTFTQCRRKWALSYHWQFGTDPQKAKPAGVMQLGSRVHLALESYYGYQLDPVAVLNFVYDDVAGSRPDYEHELRKERDLAVIMVEGYLQWVAETGADAGLKILATEREERREVALPSGKTVILRGKLDQLIRRDIDGAILQRDLKTVGTFAKAELLILDTQMRFYAMLQQLNAEGRYRTDGGLYTMLLRSKRTDRATGPFYQQIEVRYNENDLHSQWLRTIEIAGEILRTKDRLDGGEDHRQAAYPSPGDHCRWSCDFLNICPLMDDGSRWQDALRSMFVRVDPYGHYQRDNIEKVRQAFAATGDAHAS